MPANQSAVPKIPSRHNIQTGTVIAMILITGATGTIGSQVLRIFAARGEQVRAMARAPAKIPPTTGVEVVQADYNDPASLARAVTGIKTVFLVTAPESPTPRHDLAMIEAARTAGVTKMVKLSAIGTGEELGDHIVGAWHLKAERAVRDSGMSWTVLRPTTFASNSLWWADMIKAKEPIPNLTGAGRQGIIHPRDVAAVAVEVMLSPVHDERIYTLTGPELLSVPDQATCLSRELGHPVTTIELSLEEAAKQMRASGMHESSVDTFTVGVAWTRAGHNAIVTDEVTHILGRPPTSFQIWAHENRDAFGTG
jgi:uncharacterized protein YbjT (DUF2867 family)